MLEKTFDPKTAEPRLYEAWEKSGGFAPTSDPALSADGVSQSEQAAQIRSVLAAAAATPYCGPAFVYSIRDTDTADRAERESNFGALLTTDWQPKAAAVALAR